MAVRGGGDELWQPAEVPSRAPRAAPVQEMVAAGAMGPPGQAPNEGTLWGRGNGGEGRGPGLLLGGPR